MLYISHVANKDCMDEQVEEKVTSFCDEEDDDDDKDSAAAGDGGLLSEIENALGMGFGTLGTSTTFSI